MNEFQALLNEPVPAPDVQARRRAQFAQANASMALEGMVATAHDLAIQELIAAGKLTHQQAVDQYLAAARAANGPS